MSIPDTDRLEISAVLTSLCLCMTRISTNHQLSGAILAAATLSSSPSFLATIHALEFPPAATPYLHKVARYRTAADQIVSGLQYVLHQARSLPDSFQVTTVDRVSSLFSASEDDEPDSLDRYLRDHLGLTYASLLTGKAIATKDAWSSARSNKCLLFHAELRLALFYALNDDKYPINGYIGVSKRCCGLCDFVLKGLQKDASVGYSTEVTGSPHFFCVRTNHGGFPANWKFPRIDGLPTLLSARKLQQLQARLALIRQDLSLFLKSKVQAMVPHIRDSAANQRADESDDDEDAAFRKIVQEDDLREIMDSMS
ncbi:hypothetical protein C8R47DRAFT_794447 [Mycena vitilis]|nr:hypothetical protein C8R47DRAFT_794447 [Mycena vitilis]